MELTHSYDGGITAEIHIQCSDNEELLMHLSVIREQIKKRLKKEPDLFYDEPFTLRVEDNNCYGVHEAEIKSHK